MRGERCRWAARGSALCCGCVALIRVGCGALSAGQIDWTLFDNPGNRLSSGAALPDGYEFQLGVFDNGFAATPANTAEWAAHWRGLAAADYNLAAGGLGATFFVDENAAPFPAGKQLYVFGYRPSGTGMAEAWLATDAAWLMPSDDPLDAPVFVDLVDADTVVVGQVDAGGDWIRTARVAMTEAPPLYYAQWQLSWFDAAERADPAVSGPWADPDGDGLGNALEYLSGGNPRLMDPQPLRIEPAGSKLLLSCGFDPSARVVWKLLRGSDLVQWGEAPVQPAPNAAAGQLQLIVMAGGVSAFWRLQVLAVVVP